MNREIKRKVKAEASKIGAQMAATCVDYLPTGAAVRVQDHRAVAVLERAFTAMLRGGCVPLTLQITPYVARAFPRASDAPGVAKPWLAVGIDGAGRGTYCLRWLGIAARNEAEERALAELAMLAELSRETGRQGFPMGQAMGRA
jgi:hypothetical protein